MATTYRLTIEYEGTRYRGWQEQKNATTVAGELRRAIEEVVGERVELGGSGRTDAGVHALQQTAHLRLSGSIPAERLRRAVNDRLPADVHLLATTVASPRFHARHNASARSYLYEISTRRTAFAKRFVWWVKDSLDAERMAAAARIFEGNHDFAAFCERPDEQTSTRVVVERCEVAREGAVVLVRIVASHFLWRMVRRLVGTLARVGAGDLSASEVRAILGGQPAPEGLEPARLTAPPSGLFLERVIYPGEPELGPLKAPFPIATEG